MDTRRAHGCVPLGRVSLHSIRSCGTSLICPPCRLFGASRTWPLAVNPRCTLACTGRLLDRCVYRSTRHNQSVCCNGVRPQPSCVVGANCFSGRALGRALPLCNTCARQAQERVPVAARGCRLTIHSSRSRFAARLNSGVRPQDGWMAFYILIDKISETEGDAHYRFYDTAFPDEIGELRLDKRTETVEMVKATREAFFNRAATKIARHFRD